MIKLSELIVKPQNITPEKVWQLYFYKLWENDNMEIWEKYLELCEPYCDKYNLEITDFFHYLRDFEKLSQPDLVRIYNQIKAITNGSI